MYNKPQLGMMLPVNPDLKWTLARQLGVDYAITKAAPELSKRPAPYNYESLKTTVDQFRDYGFQLAALEGDEFDMTRIKLGLPGRDQDIEHYQQMLTNMGRLGIPLLCYNFMAGVGWFRTSFDKLERGNALTSEFNRADLSPEPETIITHSQLWDNYTYFIRAVLPTAEEAGVKLGLHPDDPPVSQLMGYARIMTSLSGFRQALSISDSPNHGVTFCQATFRAMGEDVPACISEFCQDKRLFFFHFRDIQGTKDHFRETFHDNGPTCMPALLKQLSDHNFTGLIRPDHTPTMAGEDNNDNPGYANLGNIFAIGYIRGIIDAQASAALS